jgi:hypothetical protein
MSVIVSIGGASSAGGRRHRRDVIGRVNGRSGPSIPTYARAVTEPATFDDLLDELRSLPGLVERGKRPGTFYRRSRPFLHFHGSGHGRTADLRTGDDWTRLPAATPADRAALLAAVEARL